MIKDLEQESLKKFGVPKLLYFVRLYKDVD